MLALGFMLAGARAFGVDSSDTLLLSQPDISARHIAFVYDGDIWIADRGGGPSRRLTTAEGQEARPHFSADGTAIAFSANYDGNVDVYVIPVTGGAPQRLTWHGAEDIAEGFDAQGRVLFSSQRSVHTGRDVHLFAIGRDGVFPTRLPIPMGADADATQTAIAYAVMPPMMFEALMQWKGYRGGSVSRIAIMNFADHSMVRLPQPPDRSNDLNPLWIGGTLYFNSDRNGEFNLFSFEPRSGEVRQLTSYDDFPVVDANAGDGRIIYEQAGRLHVFDPQSGSTSTLRIATNSDLRETRPRRVSNVEYVRSVSGSPDFGQLALEYRGEIIAAPAKKGPAFHNLTRSPGANDRSPAWSPSGGRIAWFSDESGEYSLHIGDAGGAGEVRRIAIDGGAGFYRDLKWSPDERHVSFLDNAYSLFIVDVQSGRAQRIAENDYFGHSPFISHNWSPDSQWLAYTQNANGLIQTVHLYSLAQGESFAVTDGLTEVSEPVFDRNGRYLYVIASDQAGPVKDWFSQASLDIAFTHSLYAIVLRKGDASPLPREGETPPEPAKESEAASTDVDVTIDLEGIRDRIVALPTGGATLRNLQVGKSGELYYLWTPATPAAGALSSAAELKRFVMRERTAKTLSGGVDAYYVSANGEKLLLRQGKDWKTALAGAEIKPENLTTAPLEDVSVTIDPRQEWRQIVREAWRLNRDYFYDPNYHGVDWDAIWKKYEPFIAHAATRADVGRIISAMASELRVGHSYSTSGESIDEPADVGVGLLGADFEIADGRYRFSKVLGGLNWRSELRAPLRKPGVAVSAGEYLLAVEGRPLTAEQNLYAAFQNRVDRPIAIKVGPRADGRDARTLEVIPIASERELRYVDWVEGNIRKVAEATDGRVAYVHVPDTSVEGHASFKRYFFPQSHQDALILDGRNNGGGFVADYYMDVLRATPTIRWATRYGKDLVTPRAAIFGPKVLISNEGAGSGGDLLPWMFRKFQVGPIVGTRTWGGLVGNLEIHVLMDGATVTAPNIAGWTPADGWVIENEGVAPDIEVEESPRTVLAGRDPQLEKAIEVVMQALSENPPAEPPRPAYPIRVGSDEH